MIHSFCAGVAKVESNLEGHKNLGPVKNEINMSHVKNIRSVNKENNQLSLVKPVYGSLPSLLHFLLQFIVGPLSSLKYPIWQLA